LGFGYYRDGDPGDVRDFCARARAIVSLGAGIGVVDCAAGFAGGLWSATLADDPVPLGGYFDASPANAAITPMLGNKSSGREWRSCRYFGEL
jgi:hypothetical protein